jgi:hypothetical protein
LRGLSPMRGRQRLSTLIHRSRPTPSWFFWDLCIWRGPTHHSYVYPQLIEFSLVRFPGLCSIVCDEDYLFACVLSIPKKKGILAKYTIHHGVPKTSVTPSIIWSSWHKTPSQSNSHVSRTSRY